MSKILVTYYSRTGNTRKIAEAIASRLGADIEEIVDTVDRKGVLGYLRSGFEGFLGRPAVIQEPGKDPAAYDLVIAGTPVWSSSVSAPVRTYLSRMGSSIPNVAFFLTHGGTGENKVLRQMEKLCGKAPLAVLGVRELEVAHEQCAIQVAAFTERILRRLLPVHAAA